LVDLLVDQYDGEEVIFDVLCRLLHWYEGLCICFNVVWFLLDLFDVVGDFWSVFVYLCYCVLWFECDVVCVLQCDDLMVWMMVDLLFLDVVC